MAGRERSYGEVVPQGTFRRIAGSIGGGGTKQIGYGKCIDVVDPDSDCGWLDVDSQHIDGGIIRGNGSSGRYFSDYIADGVWLPNFDHIGVSGVPANSDLALRSASRSSPSRPYVDVPVNVLQLGELTQLVKSVGGNILRQAARKNIEYQFGIAPLVGDLVKLLNFHDQTNRRIKEIKRLAGPRGLRKTYDYGSWSNTSGKEVIFQSDTASIRSWCTGTTTVGKRCHVRWHATDDLQRYRSNSQLRKLAQKAVLGMTFDAYTAWQIMPWSWFIDWGFDISAYLKASRNIVPAQLGSCVVMTHTKTEWTCPSFTHPTMSGITMSSVKSVKERKMRQPAVVSPIAHFPLLSGNQMGILSSLYIMKHR
jgi:hypothetical protein